jgi:Holliday junction DNA helicase RuvA
MLTRLSAQLESISDDTIPIATLCTTPDMAIEVLVPTYLAHALEDQINARITLHTRVYLEAQGQGTSFLPRVIGFGSPVERAFFEVFTSVKGVGTKKALRALVEPPSTIAAWIVSKDAKALTKLPEIGKRSAETMIAELSGKIDKFAGDAIIAGLHAAQSTPASSTIEHSALPSAALEAVAALMALGEQRSAAEQKVQIAMTKVDADADVDVLVQTVFGG